MKHEVEDHDRGLAFDLGTLVDRRRALKFLAGVGALTLGTATSAGARLTTSQLALPEDSCKQGYATDGYSSSVRNLVQTSLARDNVFSDGYSQQLAAVTGDVSAGFLAALTVPVGQQGSSSRA